MKKIITHLWFDRQAKEAAELYTSLFESSKIMHSFVLENTPSGDAEMVTFQLAGQEFQSISGGPTFKFNPSFSLMVKCATEEEVRKLWQVLKTEGRELMPLGEYPFSKLYAWVEDRYGLSWQLMFTAEEKITQKISTTLLFSNGVTGMTEDAVAFYQTVFEHSAIKYTSYFEEGQMPNPKAKVGYLDFQLEGTEFVAMDNGNEVDYHFNESVSFIVNCHGQQELDYYWEKLSYVKASEQCGWLKDKFGVSWQIVPSNMGELMGGTPEQQAKATEALLQMKKIDIAQLKQAKLK